MTRRQWLPLAYLGLALLAVAVLLPTALRPPPDEASQSAEFSPDAPPDEDPETIIQTLQQAGSRTAGATGNEGGTPQTTTTVPVVRAPTRGQCYGDPPRQFDSEYSPPCRAAFVGDNGGKTAPRGVTATEIRIGLSPDLSGVTSCGEIMEEPPADEDGARRTYRVLMSFFNRNLELYGRKMRWFFACAPDGTAGEPAERARGTRMAEEYQAFASIGEFSGFVAEEATRRQLIHFANIVVAADKFYAERAPYLWGSRTNSTKAVAFGSTYLCNRLNGNTPFPTGDPRIDYDAPRKFGILALDDATTNASVNDMLTQLKRKCGVEPPVARYTLSEDNAQGIATAMASMQANNVTTVVFMGEILSLPLQAQAADRAQYYPEWYLMGFGGFETAIELTRTVSPTQWQNAFGFSFEEIARRPAESACYRAYKSIDPQNDPNNSICNVLFHSMTFLFGAIQEAGPDLNINTFQRGLFTAFTRPPSPAWTMAGGFSPTDYTYGDYAVELFWDPAAIHPDGVPGAYVYPRCGIRFLETGIPTGQPTYMFQDNPHNVRDGNKAGPDC